MSQIILPYGVVSSIESLPSWSPCCCTWFPFPDSSPSCFIPAQGFQPDFLPSWAIIVGPEMPEENQTHEVLTPMGLKLWRKIQVGIQPTITNCPKCIGINDLGVDQDRCPSSMQWNQVGFLFPALAGNHHYPWLPQPGWPGGRNGSWGCGLFPTLGHRSGRNRSKNWPPTYFVPVTVVGASKYLIVATLLEHDFIKEVGIQRHEVSSSSPHGQSVVEPGWPLGYAFNTTVSAPTL